MESRLTALAGRYNAIEKSLANLTAALGGAAPAAAAPRPARQVAPPPADTRDTEEVTRLKRWVHEHGLTSATFHWVPSEYYQQNLQWRRDILGAPSSQHLCKTIVLENTHCIHDDCSDPNNSRFYMIVFQYVERFDAEMVSRVLREKNPGVGKKKFNLRLADPDKALQLTGFSDGAVAPFGTPVPVPVILSSSVTNCPRRPSF
ncbi:YbaK/aminoacyl-tRNA synthetase-associated domain-containing protein [Angomonas deanei]|nr:YbaK/aminoacyl-tRNA synthetase-associated domain-containing protein [Angomonas deanei]|eukprot:EPY24469.1 YbaK/aminoacyl-tRNA synthetase-associated domain-containing protein [Angomonas deanei]